MPSFANPTNDQQTASNLKWSLLSVSALGLLVLLLGLNYPQANNAQTINEPFPETAAQTQGVLKVTDADFKSVVLESDRPVLVDFWADWCGPCHLLSPTIEELAIQFGNSVKVVKLNVDENPETVAAYQISSIPAVLLFKDGKVVEKLLGVHPKQLYVQALAQIDETGS